MYKIVYINYKKRIVNVVMNYCIYIYVHTYDLEKTYVYEKS